MDTISQNAMRAIIAEYELTIKSLNARLANAAANVAELGAENAALKAEKPKE